MSFQYAEQAGATSSPPPGLLRAETCLSTLLSRIGTPITDGEGPTIAALVLELLRSDPRAVNTALRRLASTWAPAPAVRRRYRLTKREIDVAHLLALGKSNGEIAAALSISEHTCRHHTERVFAKMGVHSRAAVGARLRELSEPAAVAS
jgi:DNA-binding NarL/FixJ family response regulator